LSTLTTLIGRYDAKDYVVIKTGGKLEKILIKFDYIDTKKPHKNKTLDLNDRLTTGSAIFSMR
jgi:hypothetical protein